MICLESLILLSLLPPALSWPNHRGTKHPWRQHRQHAEPDRDGSPIDAGGTADDHDQAAEPEHSGWRPVSREVVQDALGPSMPASSALRPMGWGDNPGNVYVCTEPGWGGDCAVISFTASGVCSRLPPAYYRNVGAMGPDRGASARLTTSSENSCRDDLTLKFPGEPDLTNFNGENVGKEVTFVSVEWCEECWGGSN